MLSRTINLLYNQSLRHTNNTISTTLVRNTLIQSNKLIYPHKTLTSNVINKIKLKNNNEEGKQYFAKEDPDIFGTLNKPVTELIEKDMQEESDIKEESYLENPVSRSKKLHSKQYADIIKAHIRKRQIKEAIDVLEVRMLKEDRVKPEGYIYNLILGACGRIGYSKKAFKLYNDMKKRGLLATGGTYTALFNACSNSPWIEDGLSRATNLRNLMIEKGVIPNDTNYNAMIKAFGRCGDIKTAFNLVDEMINNKITVNADTINFLLQSCISDKDAGFRHALLVWRKFYNKNITPNIYSFNLMLRCIRDCSLGDSESIENLLKSPEFNLLSSDNLKLESSKIENKLRIESPNIEDGNSKFEQNTNNFIPNKQNQNLPKIAETQEKINMNWPNLMARTPYLGKIVKLNEITKAEDRLLLVGGCSGFLNSMQQFNSKPDIKTFTQLLDCLPGTISAEKYLLSVMKKEAIKYDVDFLNMLIKKRSLRFDYQNAKEVIFLFNPPKLRPDVVTFGVLALGCKYKDEAESLLKEMREAGYHPNTEILGAMVRQGSVHFNFKYVLFIMEYSFENRIKANKMFIQHLEDLYKRSKEESKENKTASFVNGFKLFRARYKIWKNEIQMNEQDDVHPWEQFRKPMDTNPKNYIDPNVYFKPRVTSKFRVKTGTLKKNV